MGNTKESAKRTGIGTLSLLGVVFITLKLTHVIDWSWVWVLVPFWGGTALFLVLAIIVAIIVVIANR